MHTPQPAIFNETAKHYHYLEFQITQFEGFSQHLKTALAGLKPSERMVSFGRQAWLNLTQNLPNLSLPESLVDFTTINGLEGHTALGTQTDLFIWLQGDSLAQVFQSAMAIENALRPVAELVFDERGFDYFNSMDLIGFEDGTANPKTTELKTAAAIIPMGQPGAGGSLVLCQQWLHNLSAWNQVPVSCQEKIVGRTKDTNEELEGDAMPSNSHVSRTDLKVDGVGMKIYRRSTPFGNLHQNGLMFLAFACDLKRFTTQLDSMYGLADGQIDQLMNYSKAIRGGYWFAPSEEDLAQLLQTNP
ncbi:Dyp-type peroxidase [Thiosulfativibrio zosterae]|uniref:Deferrochelatase/peroxidase YfeX n=1 Tax=Thiosulfativibrio zosterae TaxID=2675053 RepID=A0A6F8PJT7_9GAMM|nr:Dyp-type peroxidase [Thiosulfativibrio zosterae]BBP42324.1 deferrochelatase/peroxidase YfeX [Thiosulfativibrio zosterae]